jgi:protein DGCR14
MKSKDETSKLQVANTFDLKYRPFAQPKPAEPLEEDEYIAGLARIIKRDFYPDLDKLKVQNELLEALNTSNEYRASQLSLQLAQMTGKTDRNILGTPRMEGSLHNESESTEKSIVNSNLHLDAFQRKYTSEDNASFSEILKKENLVQKQRYAHFYARENKTARQAITGQATEQLLLEHVSLPLDERPTPVKSALIYGPEGLPLCPADIPITRGQPKSLNREATRFENPDALQVEQTESKASVSKVWTEMANATPGLFQGSDTPQVNGYKYVPSTPELAPKRDIDPSEMMTWGVIDSTPVIADHGGGPQFSMAPTPKRELTAQALSAKASAAIRKRQGAVARFKTPLARGLSPAAQLLKSTLHKSSSLGQALRSSYSTPKVSSSPRFTPLRQPTATPQHQSNRPMSTQSKKGDITDGLLDL